MFYQASNLRPFLLSVPLLIAIPFFSACPDGAVEGDGGSPVYDGGDNGDGDGDGDAGSPVYDGGDNDSGTVVPPDGGGNDSGTVVPPDAGSPVIDGGDSGTVVPPDAGLPLDGGVGSSDSGIPTTDAGDNAIDGGPGLEVDATSSTSCTGPFPIEISAAQPVVTVHTPANLLSPLTTFPTGVVGCHPPSPGAADFHYSVELQEETFLLVRVENEMPEANFQFQIIGITNCSDPEAFGKPTPFYCGPQNPPENATARLLLGAGTYPIVVVQWLQSFPSFPQTETWNFTFQVRRLEFVSLDIAPNTPVQIQVGNQFQMGATATLTENETANLTPIVSWESSDPSIASIDNGQAKGLLSALVPGETTITITYATQNTQASTTVTVIP